jgi:hypothetical protein
MSTLRSKSSTGKHQVSSPQPKPEPQGSGIPPARRAGAGQAESRDTPLVQRAVERVREGDPEGLHFLYVRYAAEVLRYVAGFVGDHQEAEEITQGVFATLVTEIGMYEQREEQFAAWILRTARKAAFDYVFVRTLEAGP